MSEKIHSELLDHFLGKKNDEVASLLQTNPEYQKVYEEMQWIRILAKSEAQQTLKNKIKKDLKTIKRKRIQRNSFLSAVAIIAITTLFYIAFSPKKQTNKEDKPSFQKSDSLEKNNTTSTQIKPTIVPTILPLEKSPKKQKSITAKKVSIDSSLVSTTKNDVKTITTVKEETQKTVTLTPPPIEKNKEAVFEIKKEDEPTDCSTTTLSFDYTTTSSCEQQKTGSIQIIISSITGGNLPYLTRVAETNQENMNGYYAELSASNYTVSVIDRDNCSSSKTITIDSKPCIEFQKLQFNPNYSQFVSIPILGVGQLEIRTRSGIRIFQDQTIDEDFYNWNGKSENGNNLNPGTYIYTINYEDASMSTGQITISR